MVNGTGRANVNVELPAVPVSCSNLYLGILYPVEPAGTYLVACQGIVPYLPVSVNGATTIDVNACAR